MVSPYYLPIDIMISLTNPDIQSFKDYFNRISIYQMAILLVFGMMLCIICGFGGIWLMIANLREDISLSKTIKPSI